MKKYKKYQEKLKNLESQQKYDVDVNYGEYKFIKQQEPNHRYIYNRFIDKIYYVFLRVIVFIFAPILLFFTYRLRIKGRKNLKKCGKNGGIVVCNHVALLDCLITKQTIFKKAYFVGAEHNNKRGFGGYTIKLLGFLPLSSQFSNQKNLDSAITYYISQGKLVCLNPEQAMWRGYTKLRPFKNGAFYYAVKNNVPIIPIVHLIRKANWWDNLWGRHFKITTQVLPPVYANNDLPTKQRIEDLKTRSRDSMIKVMNDFYGTECDVTKIDEANKTQEKSISTNVTTESIDAK